MSSGSSPGCVVLFGATAAAAAAAASTSCGQGDDGDDLPMKGDTKHGGDNSFEVGKIIVAVGSKYRSEKCCERGKEEKIVRVGADRKDVTGCVEARAKAHKSSQATRRARTTTRKRRTGTHNYIKERSLMV